MKDAGSRAGAGCVGVAVGGVVGAEGVVVVVVSLIDFAMAIVVDGEEIKVVTKRLIKMLVVLCCVFIPPRSEIGLAT